MCLLCPCQRNPGAVQHFCSHGERQEMPSLADSTSCCPCWAGAGLLSSSCGAAAQHKELFGYKTQVCCFHRPKGPSQGAPQGLSSAGLCCSSTWPCTCFPGRGGAQPREQSKGMPLDFFRKPALDNPIYFVNGSCRALCNVLGSAGLEHRARSRSSSNTLGQQGMLREPGEGCFLSQSILTNISCLQTCQSSKQSAFGEGGTRFSVNFSPDLFYFILILKLCLQMN